MSIKCLPLRTNAALLLSAGLALSLCSSAALAGDSKSCPNKPPSASSSSSASSAAAKAERAKARAEAQAIRKAIAQGIESMRKQANAGRKAIAMGGKDSISMMKEMARDGASADDLTLFAVQAQQDLLVDSSAALAALDDLKAGIDASLAGKTVPQSLMDRLQSAYERAGDRISGAADSWANKIDDKLQELLNPDDSEDEDGDGSSDCPKPPPAPTNPPPAA